MKKINLESLCTQAIKHKNDGNLKKAQKILLQLEKRGIDEDEILFQLGYIYQKNEEFDKALKLFEAVLNINPQWTDVLFNIGYIYLEKKRYKKAVQIFDQFVKIEPNSFNSWFNLGCGYFGLEMFHEALEAYEYGLEIEPEDLDGLHGLGLTCIELKLYDRATDAFNQCLKIDLRFKEAWYGLGSIFKENGEFDDAISALNKYIEFDSQDEDAWILLGDVYLRIEKNRKAIECYRKAIVLNKRNERIWNNLGVCYERIEDFDKEFDAYNEALRINPHYVLPRYNISKYYKRREEFDRAIKELEKILESDSTYSDAWSQLGSIYSKKKEIKKAIEFLNCALKHAPKDKHILKRLGKIYYLEKKYEKAIECFEKAIKIDPLFESAWNYLKRAQEEKSISSHEGVNIQILRGGDWRIEGNRSIFYYKVKIKNKSQFVITNIQVFLTSLPGGLSTQSDRHKIGSLRPDSYESPTFKLLASESCVGDLIEGVVTYADNRGKSHTKPIKPFEIKYVCNLLVPKQINIDDFEGKTNNMEKKELTIESDKKYSELIPKIRKIVENCNFALLRQLQTSQNENYRKVLGFSQGLYDKQDVALSIAVQKLEKGSKLVVKAMSNRNEKLTDILKDFNLRLDDIKSDTELIKEYSSQIEIILEKTEYVEQYLRKHLGSDWEKIKYIWEDYKNGKISKKELLKEGVKILGKKFIKYLLKVMV